jgi:hypothetical protein
MTQQFVNIKVERGATVENASGATLANKVVRGEEHFKQIVTPESVARSAAALERLRRQKAV